MSIQIAFRESKEYIHDYKMIMAIGIFEMDDAFASDVDEKFLTMKLDFRNNGTLLSMRIVNDLYKTIGKDDPYSCHFEIGEIDTAVNTNLERMIPTQFSNAELYMRRTQIEPTSDNRTVMAFCGLVGVNSELSVDVTHITQLEALDMSGSPLVYGSCGCLGREIRPGWGDIDIESMSRGSSLNMMLKLAVWGFSDEPVGLQSTMPLSTLEKLDRYKGLLFVDRNVDQEKQFSEIEPWIRRAGLDVSAYNDPRFEYFCQELKSRGLDFKSSAPLTRGQIEDRSMAATEIVREYRDASPIRLGY